MQPRPSPASILVLAAGLVSLGACQRSKRAVPVADQPSTTASDTASDTDGESEPEAPAIAVRPELPARGVAGVVVREDGAPIDGARVCAWTKRPPVKVIADEMFAPVCTNSNHQGGYALELEPGVWRVVASASEREPEHLNVVIRSAEPKRAVDLTLGPGGRLQRGRVLDPLGQPVVGAQIWANLYVGVRDRGFVQTTTGADGSFELWTTHYSHIWVRAEGYAHDFFIHEGDDYRLIPASVIRGRVVNAQGKAAAGVRVATQDPYSLYGDRDDATRTNAEGEFELGGLLSGTHGVVALADDSVGRAVAEVDYHQTRDALVLRLEPWPRLRIRVVEAGVGPVAMCGIDIVMARKPDDLGERFWTDEDGQIDVPLRPGRYHLAQLNCRSKVGAPLTGSIRLERDLSLELEVSSGRSLRGRALTAKGQPLADEQLWLREPSRSEGRDPVFDFIDPGPTQTDAQGRFELSGLIPGRYTLGGGAWMSFEGMPNVIVSDEPATEVELRLPPSAHVEVQSNLAQWDQHARLSQCLPSGRGWSGNQRSDSQGLGVFEHVPPGEFVVAMDATPYCSREHLTRLELSDGETVRVEVPAEVRRTKTIVVHVEGPGGEPIPGALVQLNGDESSSVVDGVWSRVDPDECAMTDAEGVARIETVAQTAIVSVEALAPGLMIAVLSAHGEGRGRAPDEDDYDEDDYEDYEDYDDPELEGTRFTLRMRAKPEKG